MLKHGPLVAEFVLVQPRTGCLKLKISNFDEVGDIHELVTSEVSASIVISGTTRKSLPRSEDLGRSGSKRTSCGCFSLLKMRDDSATTSTFESVQNVEAF